MSLSLGGPEGAPDAVRRGVSPPMGPSAAAGAALGGCQLALRGVFGSVSGAARGNAPKRTFLSSAGGSAAGAAGMTLAGAAIVLG